jgi:membrane protein
LRQAIGRALNEDDITGRAAQLAYFFFLSIFPLLISLIALTGIVPFLREHVRAGVSELTARFLPGSAAGLVEQILEQVMTRSRATKLSIGIAVTVWSGSSGISALIDAMNAQYGVEESRPYLEHQAIAIVLSVVAGILFLLAGAIMLISADFLGPAIAAAWDVFQWPVALALVLLALSVIYHYAPNLKRKGWRWITPGATVGLFLWLGASYGFRVYLRYFNTYGAVYGSLGTVIIAMLWFYISSLAVLLGSEVNVVLESRAAKSGKEERRLADREQQRAEEHGRGTLDGRAGADPCSGPHSNRKGCSAPNADSEKSASP